MNSHRLLGVSMASVLGVGLAFVACGSDADKRRVMGDGDGGLGGADSRGGEPAAAPAGGVGADSAGGRGGGSPGEAGRAGDGVGGVEAAGGAGLATPGGAGGTGGDGGDGYSDEPIAGDAFVSPTGSDLANDCQTEATPCKTIAYAATQAAPNHTLWLADATFTSTDQTTAATVATGLRVRARTLGSGVVSVRLTLLGDNRVEGVVIDGGASAADNPGIDMTTGAITLEGVAFRGYLVGPLRIGGDAVVTIQPGNLSDYAADFLAQSDVNAYDPFCEVANNAELTIAGGTFGGPGIGHGSQLPGAYGAAFVVRDTARLTLEGATLKVRSRGIVAMDTASVVVRNSSVSAVVMTSAGYGVWATSNVGTASITVEGSTISGFAYSGNSGSIAMPEYAAASQATISVTDSTLSASSHGVYIVAQATAQMTFEGVELTNNLFSGLYCLGTCSLDMTGGSVTGNAFLTPTPWGYYGGLSFSAPDKAYSVKLRGVMVADNRNTTVDGNTNNEGNSGVSLAGTAASAFDLGTSADPGGNTFIGNDTGNATTNLNVKVNAGVTVSAVGNTFDPSLQGANASGVYLLGAAPCGASTCNLSTGTGANYRVASGTLRLAE